MSTNTEMKETIVEEKEITLDFFGLSKFTFRHTTHEYKGETIHNMYLVGRGGAIYELRAYDAYGKHGDKFSGVYVPYSFSSGQQLRKKGNAVFIFMVAGIIEADKRFLNGSFTGVKDNK